MSKLSLDALKMRAEAVASEDLLMAISGGTENSCHDSSADTKPDTIDYTGNPLVDPIIGVINLIRIITN
jgi:hypothetical protein